jgi:hypothetical protein
MPDIINGTAGQLDRFYYSQPRLAVSAMMSIALAACSGMDRLPDASSAEAQAFQTRCGTCHGLPHPHRHTYAQWEYVMTMMEMRIRERGMNPLSSDDRDAILRYLKDNARTD